MNLDNSGNLDEFINHNFPFILDKPKDKNYLLEKIKEMKLLRNHLILSIIKETQMHSIHQFLMCRKELSSLSDVNNHWLMYGNFKDAIRNEELEELLVLKEKYEISNDDFNELLSTLGTVFILHDLISAMHSPVFSQMQSGIAYLKNILSFLKKNRLTSKEDLSSKKFFSYDLSPLYKYRSILNSTEELIKRPNFKLTNIALNSLCLTVDHIAQRKEISKNLADFTIPLLKDLKEMFPEQLKGIKKLDKSYLLKKISSGKDLKIADDNERRKYEISNPTLTHCVCG